MNNLTYHQIILVIVVGFILFVIGKVGGTYLQEIVKAWFKKKPLQGTEEACGTCPALLSYRIDIPLIKKKQEDRDVVLGEFNKSIVEFKTAINSLDARVQKLFSLMEADWRNEITELRTAVREKNAEIEHLKKTTK